MNEADEHNGIAAIFRDEDGRRRLRADLAVTARRTDDPELSGLIRDVLQGRGDVMSVFQHPTFDAMAQRSLDNVEAALAELDEQTREELLDPDRPRTPDAELDALRDAATPGADKAVRNDAEGRRDPKLKHLR